MGMSASQARLIALTARMSDTEYEAQQINQQRLTLSNQMNAVYEAMCNMDVPTPPSKLDPVYMKTVYKGKQGGTDITAKINSNGTVSAYNTVNGDVVKATGSKRVSRADDPAQYLSEELTYNSFDYEMLATGVDTTFYSGAIVYKDENNQEKTYTYTYSLSSYADNTTFSIDGVEYNIESVDEKETVITKEEAQAHNAEASKRLAGTFCILDENGLYKEVTKDDLKDGDKYYICDEENKNNLRLALNAQDAGKSEGTTVGGNPVMSIAEADATYGNNESAKEAWNNALNGLKNTFPDDDRWKSFSVIQGRDSLGNYVFSFCMTDDLNDKDDMVQTWQYAKGDYDKKIADLSKDEVTYDTNGNISSIMVNGQSVSLTVEHEIDEYAYEAAMNKYNSDKAVYDQEQNNLNRQTSIYQRQDKMLELKLTRLENERNALNTEIEAVKKVIQDAIDRGFKTFSG